MTLGSEGTLARDVSDRVVGVGVLRGKQRLPGSSGVIVKMTSCRVRVNALPFTCEGSVDGVCFPQIVSPVHTARKVSISDPVDELV